MKKILALLVLFVIAQQYAGAQRVTKTYVNFKELAAYEAAHPEIFKCETCPKREADDWEGIDNPNMPFPAGAKITTNNYVNSPTPNIASRAPIQNWLGHIDNNTTIPPDTHGAVGLNHVVTATNSFVKIHAKVGGAQISQVTFSSFIGQGGASDPYIIFDPSAQRWIITGIGTTIPNPVILLVSNTSDPTGTWTRISFFPTGSNILLDHPYVGFDNQWIVISGRRFPNGSSFAGSSLFLIDKAAMYAGATITFGTNAQQIDKTSGDGDCPLPVTLYEPPFSNSGNPSPGTFYILQSWNGTSIRLTTVTGTIPAATWNTAGAVFPSGGTPWNAGNLNNAVEQVTETRKLAANDARISSGVMMNGKIWCAHPIAFPTAGVPDRIAVQWWQLDGTPGANFGNVLQRGRIGGNNPNEYKWFPSIAVNKDEDVIIGYSASDITTHVNAAYATREATTALNTTDDEFIFKTGLNRYWKDFGSGRARWGDYSHSSLDPVDNTLWTIQEYAEQGVGTIPPDNNSRFGVWWAQIDVSAPPFGFTFDNPAPFSAACPAPASMNITLGTVATGGFSNPITLSATGNPVGTTVTFAPNPVTPGNSTVVTFGGTNTLNNGNYTISVTGTAIGVPNQTRDIIFTINPGAAPTINTHPASQTLCAGGNVTFTTSATGALTYQWQVSTNGGGLFTDMPGETATSLIINGVTGALNNNQYRCVVRGQCNTANTNAAVLTVNTPPAITTQPASVTLCAGSNNTFGVTATGSGLTYQWQISTNGGGLFTDISGATSSTLLISGITAGMNANQYRVVITGSCTPALTSAAAILTVVSPATVTTQPSNVTICDPGNTSFTTAGTGAGIIQWQFSTDGGANYNNVPNTGVYSGATTATLNITGGTVSMNGYRYRALLSNATCTTPAITTAAILTVNTVPAITADPQSITLCTGSNNTFNVTANGSGLTYQWQVSTNGGGLYTDIPGATNSSYTLAGITVGMNNNRYRVVVSGACTPPATSGAAVLTAIAPVAVTTQPSDAAICETGNVSFSVTATSVQTIAYQWQISTDGGTTWNNIAGATTNTLNLNGVTPALNNNRYRLLMSSATCTTPTISNAVILTVNARPTVTLSASPYTSLFPGLSSTITATILPSAAGFNISWFRNGTLIPGVTGTTYTADVTKLGDYRVDIINPTTGCNNTSSLLTIKDSASTRLFIYPSPNDGAFTVAYHYNGSTGTQRTVSVFDAKGAKVYQAKFPVTGPYTLLSIDVKPAQTGIYVVVVADASGKKLAEGKVLVH